MTIITNDIIISKKTNQVLLMIQFEFKIFICHNKARPNWAFKFTLKKRFDNVLLECWMEK